MTSKITIPVEKRKLPDHYLHGNLVGVISVHSGRRKLKSSRFYSIAARKIIMEEWIKEYQDNEIFFIIKLDKIPD